MSEFCGSSSYMRKRGKNKRLEFYQKERKKKKRFMLIQVVINFYSSFIFIIAVSYIINGLRRNRRKSTEKDKRG